MPTEKRFTPEMISVPPYIGLEPLAGLYYPAQCRSCGWVGSSEELTEDDAQCTRDVGDRLCLGDCDELGRDDLLGIIQAMAKAQQHQGEPVAVLYANGTVLTKADCGDVFDICCKVETPLYTRPAPAGQGDPVECAHEWTDDGEFLLVCTNCGEQEDHAPKWRDMATAPRDGTLIRLLVEFNEHATEDSEAMPCPTIGANSFDHTGEDLWQFAGWSWEQDCFTRGAGKPIGWLPMLDSPHADPAEVERLRAEVKRLQHNSVKEEVFDIVCKERDTLRAQIAEQATLVKWWKDHLAVHIAILFGTLGHSPEDAEKNADDVIKRAERLAPTVSASAEPGEIERLRGALKFYADREHFHFESGNWDTVSGEPLNILWCGDEPDLIEDGTVARNALSASAEPSAPAEIDERAEFEKAVIDKAERFYPNLEQFGEHPDAEYRDPSIEWAWGLWQARAALERKS